METEGLVGEGVSSPDHLTSKPWTHMEKGRHELLQVILWLLDTPWHNHAHVCAYTCTHVCTHTISNQKWKEAIVTPLHFSKWYLLHKATPSCIKLLFQHSYIHWLVKSLDLNREASWNKETDSCGVQSDSKLKEQKEKETNIPGPMGWWGNSVLTWPDLYTHELIVDTAACLRWSQSTFQHGL